MMIALFNNAAPYRLAYSVTIQKNEIAEHVGINPIRGSTIEQSQPAGPCTDTVLNQKYLSLGKPAVQGGLPTFVRESHYGMPTLFEKVTAASALAAARLSQPEEGRGLRGQHGRASPSMNEYEVRIARQEEFQGKNECDAKRIARHRVARA
eukprot:1157817-Pelagomonas_calceolata.AAC.18